MKRETTQVDDIENLADLSYKSMIRILYEAGPRDPVARALLPDMIDRLADICLMTGQRLEKYMQWLEIMDKITTEEERRTHEVMIYEKHTIAHRHVKLVLEQDTTAPDDLLSVLRFGLDVEESLPTAQTSALLAACAAMDANARCALKHRISKMSPRAKWGIVSRVTMQAYPLKKAIVFANATQYEH